MDIIGQKFGQWCVIDKDTRKHYVVCKCDCGKIQSVYEYNLIKNKTSMCSNCSKSKSKRPYEDISGQRFGRLVALHLDNTIDSKSGKYWICKCDCGNLSSVRTGHLKSGAIQSCGCLKRQPQNYTHQLSNTILYKKWCGIKRRCYNPNESHYSDYGGRGIKMCDEWKNDFKSFYDWSISNGYSDGLTIDRIDFNGDYTPDNCRWVDNKIQQNNKRSNVFITCFNQTMTLHQWSD